MGFLNVKAVGNVGAQSGLYIDVHISGIFW